MITKEALWQTIDEATIHFKSYKETFKRLSMLSQGYALCFAFHYVDAEIINGGISQLYSNPTWSLVLAAIEACHRAKSTKLEQILREVVLYYHQRDRSRLKRQLTEEFFAGIKRPMAKSLSELEDEYNALDQEKGMVIPILLSDESLWK